MLHIDCANRDALRPEIQGYETWADTDFQYFAGCRPENPVKLMPIAAEAILRDVP
jgi:hypothetical protein